MSTQHDSGNLSGSDPGFSEDTSGESTGRMSYTVKLTVALAAAAVAMGVAAFLAYGIVAAEVQSQAALAAVQSGFVGMFVMSLISLALVGVTVGSNTAITLRMLSSKAERIEQGDMDVHLEADRTDEFGDLARSLAAMRTALRRRIEEIEETSRENERRKERLEEQAREIARQMESLSANSEEVAAAADELVETSEQAASAGEDGRRAAESAIEGMDTVEANTDRTLEEIRDLERTMEEIADITGTISEIARRTNILAVNARIESSRSESAGQGYSVVADEIRDLAEKVEDAADEIEAEVRDAQRQTSRTVDDVERARANVSEAAEAVEETVDSIDVLAEYTRTVDRHVKNIRDATDEQAIAVETVATAANRLTEGDDHDWEVGVVEGEAGVELEAGAVEPEPDPEEAVSLDISDTERYEFDQEAAAREGQ